MKITCVQENLAKALIHSSRLISLRSTLPILENVLLTTDQGRLKISATDLELGINYWIGVKIEEDGGVAVPSRLITEFVSNIREEKINLITSTFDVKIEGEKYNATIKGMNPEDFPTIPDISNHHLFSIPVKQLQSAISQVIFSAAGDNTRPTLAGVLIKYEKETLKMVATDSYRLAEKTIKVSATDKKAFQCIVPSRTINEVGKLLKDAGEKIDICYDGNQILFDFGSIHLISRLIDGQYPNYEQIIPVSFETFITVEKDELMNVCKVASLFARESANSIKLRIMPGDEDGKGSLMISGQGVQIGESTNSIPVTFQGKEIEISFNAKYLLDVLPTITEKTIEMKFSGPASPGVMYGAGKDDYVYLIMPLKATN
ncbi:MAG: DNA polymerase III subunit beta [Patescibacteria group bacterium]